MKKLFVKLSMLIFVLGMSTNVAWGQGIFGDITDAVDPENPSSWFYVRLNAAVSDPGCGTTTPGKVYLINTESDDARTPQNPWIIDNPKPENPYAMYGESDWKYRQWSEEYGFTDGVNDAKNGLEKNYKDYWEDWSDNYAVKEGYEAGYDWYKSGRYLNNAGDRVTPTNPTGAPYDASAWGTSVSVKGYSMIYAPGFETDFNEMSAYAYFFGKVVENDGWYFTGWSFTEGESDLGGVVGAADSLQFRILPSSTTGETNIRDEYVYASFQPVRVSDYKVKGLINKSVSNSTTITFDVVGQRVSTADFTVSVEEENFSAAITSCENNKVTVTVTYGGSSDGEYRGNVTLASKSGCSQLTAPVYARVGADASKEATLYEGKTPTSTSGTLTAMIAAANNTDKIVVLNKNYENDLTVNAKATINFNGYTIQDLEVTGGELTVAYSKYGSSGEAVSVTGGKLILNGGDFASLTIGASGIVEQNGAVITGASENRGILITTEGRFEAGLTSYGTLTIDGGTFEGATAITVSGGTATINKATINGTAYGIEATGGITNITSKLVSVNGGTNAVKQSSGTVNLTNGKYVGETAPLAGTINLQAGYFKVDAENIGISVPTGKKVLNVLAGNEFAEGYRYFVGDDASSVGVCRIGTTSYATLEEALAYANNTGATITIIMTNDYTLPAGYYTLPANATLIVPMSNEQEVTYPIVNRVSNNGANRVDQVKPYEFRRLTFAKGVNMDVYGLIELTCTQRASDDAYATLPYGPFGHLVMTEGSHMTLQSGSELRAWGYMTGKGETDARRGSIVREQFQMGDWKGGSVSFKMLTDMTERVFPITQYYIQNVESPVKYHPGAVLSTTTSVSAKYSESMGLTAMANDIPIVGVSGVPGKTAMFLMDIAADAENTWVRKWYDAENDVQTYDVNSGAHIGSMVLELGKLGALDLNMNSGQFVLPITNNMKIHLLSGNMDFTQTTSLLPGAEVEVDKESVVKIARTRDGEGNIDENVYSGSLFIYDGASWNMTKGKYTSIVPYTPSWDGTIDLFAGKETSAALRGKPTMRSETGVPQDAKINVHGTFETYEGNVYTTSNGANIFSSNEDAGTFIFTNGSKASEYSEPVYQWQSSNGSGFGTTNNYQSKDFKSPKLKNGAGAEEDYTATAGANVGQTYIYQDHAWQDKEYLFNFGCFAAEMNADYSTGIINYAIVNSAYRQTDTQNPAGARSYIGEYLYARQVVENMGMSISASEYEELKARVELMEGQGVSSEYQSAYTYLIKTPVAAINSYNLGEIQKVYIKPQEWVELAGNATLSLDETELAELETNYRTAVLTAYYYANYGNAEAAYAAFEQCNLYAETYLSQVRNPSIQGIGNSDHTYSDAAGAGRLFIEMDDCQWWEVEKKNNLYHCIHPDNDTYYYWDEDEEMWMEKKFTITWKNWNGDIIQTADKDGNPQDEYEVTYGTMAEFLGTNPTREATVDYTYDFTGWTPALGPVTNDVTYTATYAQKDRMYTIIFQNEGGVEIERQFLKHNDVPVCENVPTKVGHTLEWSPAIAAVTGDATYTATWLEEPPTEYEVTFFDYDGTTVLQQDNVNVGDMPEYTGETPSGKSATTEYSYVFDHWAPALEQVSATSIKSYTAVYREVEREYTILYYMEDGTTPNPTKASESLPYGATPTPPAVTKENPATGHTYTLIWKNLAETSTIQTVMGNASYKPTYIDVLNKYTVTVKSNPSGACSSTGAGLYDYNTSATITLSVNDGYTFTGWSDGQEGTNTSRTITVTEDKELVANFTYNEPGVTINWKKENGDDFDPALSVNQAAGTATIFPGATPTKAETAEKTYTFYGWSTSANGGGTIYKNGLTPKATEDADYYAYFNETDRTYTITWANEAGTAIEVDYNQPYGAVTAFNSQIPTKVATADVTYAFDGWATAPNGDKVYDNDATPAVSDDVTYYAHFKATTKTTLDIGVDDVEVLMGATTLNTLIITSNGGQSGQLINANNLSVLGNAIFRQQQSFAAGQWYAVAVPWRVDPNTGIYGASGRLALGSQIYVIEFDANAYAGGSTNTFDYWTFLHQTGADMTPGKLYMIYLRSAQASLDFYKKAGASILTTETSVATTGGDDSRANWNAIANPALYYASMSTGATDVQFFNNGGYTPGSTTSMIVGQPAFAQVSTPSVVEATPAGGGSGAPAYLRAPQATSADTRFEIEIARNGKMNDRIIVQTAEEKVDKYVIGQDLAKFGVSSIVAQMWMNRYDVKLCKNTMTLVDDVAEYPLSIFAPAAGEYTLSAMQKSGDADLYLTLNGEAIWNLSDGDYVLNLNNGTAVNYGLRVSARAPQVTTGVDEAIVDAQGETRKVLINGQVFIIRGNKVYAIDGQLVK